MAAESYEALPPASRRVGIVGQGRAGRALRAELQRAGVEVAAWARGDGAQRPEAEVRPPREARARRAAGWANGAVVVGGPIPAAVLEADLTLLAVPDDALDALLPTLRGRVLLHLSGARESTDLPRPLGGALGGWHPLQALSEAPSPTLPPYPVALDGDEGAVEAGRWLAARLGHPTVRVRPGQKARYHAAAVLASNAFVALESLAAAAMAEAIEPPEAAWPTLLPLVRGTLDNLQSRSFAAALTGPVARGDAGTIQRNLAALDGPAAEAYRVLGRAALALADLDPERTRAVAEALGGRPRARP